MATKGVIAIMVKGGCVQEIRATKDIADLLTIEVYDLDESSFETAEERQYRTGIEAEYEAATSEMTIVY